jgi:hypothetical protein
MSSRLYIVKLLVEEFIVWDCVVFEESTMRSKRNFVVWISVVKSYKVFVYKSEVVLELQALWFTQSSGSMQFSRLELFE